jgi:hypothetical protein
MSQVLKLFKSISRFSLQSYGQFWNKLSNSFENKSKKFFINHFLAYISIFRDVFIQIFFPNWTSLWWNSVYSKVVFICNL